MRWHHKLLQWLPAAPDRSALGEHAGVPHALGTGAGGTVDGRAADNGAAATATRYAALLRGGMAPGQAVAALARDAPGELVRSIEGLVSDGASIGAALSQQPGAEWRVLGAAWQLAESSGAPLSAALDRIAAALRGVEGVAQRREVLLAGPRMTVRLVTWLPLVAVAVGILLGFDPLPVFFTPVGAVLLALGLLFQAVGARWANHLTAKVETQDRVAGLECELMWIALAGGAPPAAALTRVANAVAESRTEWVDFDSLREGQPLARALAAAVSAGVPASPLLLDVAHERRQATQARLEREAERLGVRILIPLASCVLPAFVTLGVAPVIITLLSGVLPV